MSKELDQVKYQHSRDKGNQNTVNCLYNSLNYQRPGDKSPQNIVFVQQKVINNLLPLETDVKLQKSFIDIAVNTEITGPLENENDSVTMVRKVKNYNNYVTYKVKTKLVQTINYKLYCFSDKASWQHVPTADYGTQVTETKAHKKEYQKQKSKGSPKIQHSTNDLQTKTEYTDIRLAETNQIDIIQSKKSVTDLGLIDMALRDYLSQMDIRHIEMEDLENRYEIKRSVSRNSNLSNVKRWALSSSLIRGPDF